MVIKIITRKEAKEQGFSWYFTGKPYKHGHVPWNLEPIIASENISKGNRYWPNDWRTF